MVQEKTCLDKRERMLGHLLEERGQAVGVLRPMVARARNTIRSSVPGRTSTYSAHWRVKSRDSVVGGIKSVRGEQG